MKIGPTTSQQIRRFATTWQQGEHVVISGGTGSGKTTLGRLVDEVAIEAGGSVIIFVAKTDTDKTIVNDYKGWTRWTDFHKRYSKHDNKILLWPDLRKAKSMAEVKEIQKSVFADAIEQIRRSGKWVVDFDEGLYMCNPMFMRMDEELAMLHALGRSSGITLITKTQRPSHLPLIIYGSASHAFVGRTREASDVKRLSEMGGKASGKELAARISAQGRHDFLWLPIAPDWDPETVNIRR